MTFRILRIKHQQKLEPREERHRKFGIFVVDVHGINTGVGTGRLVVISIAALPPTLSAVEAREDITGEVHSREK